MERQTEVKQQRTRLAERASCSVSQLCRSSVTGSCCREMTPHFTRGRSLSPRDGLQCDPGLCKPCPPGGLLLFLHLLHFSRAQSLLRALVLCIPTAGHALPPRHLLGQLLFFSVVPTSTLYLKICPLGRPVMPDFFFFFFYKATLHILTAYLVTYLSHLLLLLAELCGMWDPSSLTRI